MRALAQRSADAATEVKSKVTSASNHISVGVDLVDQTGHALSRIIDRVVTVSTAIDAIARASDHQATSLGQINVAIGEMDAMTQQNAAMVEETSAAARRLVAEAERLAGSVGAFAIDAPAVATPRHRAATGSPSPFNHAEPAPRRVANGDWDAF